jgi:hypothetical protein
LTKHTRMPSVGITAAWKSRWSYRHHIIDLHWN